jgi:hypothetical protein
LCTVEGIVTCTKVPYFSVLTNFRLVLAYLKTELWRDCFPSCCNLGLVSESAFEPNFFWMGVELNIDLKTCVGPQLVSLLRLTLIYFVFTHEQSVNNLNLPL